MASKLLRSRRARPRGQTGGRARVDRRTKELVARIEPGDVAVIDHEDLDRVAAEALVR
ncbi:MAG: putative cytokinetic ring protein SteA, partial [Gaiellaceae bacterium]